MSNATKIKHYANQIIKLADNSSGGTCKECPKYRMPDLSKLSKSIPHAWVRALWNNYHNPTSSWTCWEDIRKHGMSKMSFSDAQMNEIGVALGFLEDEEEPEPPEPPTLRIGVFRKELWNRENGDDGGMYGQPVEEFMELLVEYNLSFIRANATGNSRILEKWLKWTADRGIEVELTTADGNNPIYGNPAETIELAKNYPHVFIEPWNEFNDYRRISAEEQIGIVRRWCDYAHDRGLRVSAGAYGAKYISEMYDPVSSLNDIISIHRSYEDEADVKATIKPYKDSRKQMSWNEPHHISAQHFYNCVRWFYNEGVRRFCYYGDRDKKLFPDLPDDVSPRLEYYEKARQLRAELSP